MEKFSFKIFLISTSTLLILIFGLNSALAQVEVCGPCEPEGASADGLVCQKGKWRGCPEDGVVICNPLKACDFEELINAIIKFIFWVAVALAPLMIIIAGFYFVTSAGNPSRIETAKNIILYTLIGLLIVFLARGIISAIQFLIR